MGEAVVALPQLGFGEPLRSCTAEQHAWEQEPQFPRAFGFAGLRRRSCRSGPLTCPEHVARLAQHGRGIVSIEAGEGVPQLSAP